MNDRSCRTVLVLITGTLSTVSSLWAKDPRPSADPVPMPTQSNERSESESGQQVRLQNLPLIDEPKQDLERLRLYNLKNISGEVWIAGNNVRFNATGAVRSAVQAVGDAKGEEEKNAAQKKLTDILSQHFDEDMVQREKELTRVEERLKNLRTVIDKRRTKKHEILELQAKVLLNEADGLGFSENSSGTAINRREIDNRPTVITPGMGSDPGGIVPGMRLGPAAIPVRRVPATREP